jgi:hypothetical protein
MDFSEVSYSTSSAFVSTASFVADSCVISPTRSTDVSVCYFSDSLSTFKFHNSCVLCWSIPQFFIERLSSFRAVQ